MKTRTLLSSFLLAASITSAGAAGAAQMIINNVDPPGVGFNDKTRATPVGGNPGVTIGEQRLYAFRRALDLWSARLKSDVPIVVQGSFAGLDCDATSGVLGAAGALQIFANFPGAKQRDTWYSAALANAMAGFDLTPGKPDPGLLAPPFNDDIVAFFNGNLGQPGCLASSRWYYGLDNKAPAGTIDFLNVFMHELSHGLGFQNFIDESDGLPPAFPDFPYPDIYSRLTKDTTLNKTWDQLTPAEIVASATRDTKVAWVGEQVRADAPSVLEPFSQLTASNPPTFKENFQFAGYGPPALVATFGGQVVLVNDGVNGGPNGAFDGCEPIPPAQVSGKIALIIRGTCPFTQKSLNAQIAGAKGVIIFNNQAAGLPPLGGADPRITIPTIGVTFNAGVTLANASGPTVALTPDPTQPRFGMDTEGNVLLYAPTTYSPGSSISHFDTRAFPNLLMEPFITGTLQAAVTVDLTDRLLGDIGWERETGPGNFVVFGCDTGLPATLPGYGRLDEGLAACANSGISTHGQFVACTTQWSNDLRNQGLISGTQSAAITSCAAKRP